MYTTWLVSIVYYTIKWEYFMKYKFKCMLYKINDFIIFLDSVRWGCCFVYYLYATTNSHKVKSLKEHCHPQFRNVHLKIVIKTQLLLFVFILYIFYILLKDKNSFVIVPRCLYWMWVLIEYYRILPSALQNRLVGLCNYISFFLHN